MLPVLSGRRDRTRDVPLRRASSSTYLWRPTPAHMATPRMATNAYAYGDTAHGDHRLRIRRHVRMAVGSRVVPRVTTCHARGRQRPPPTLVAGRQVPRTAPAPS